MLLTAPVLPLVAAVMLVLTGCSGTPPTAASGTAPPSGRSETASPQHTAPPRRSTAMNIRLTVDGHRIDATLNDSAAARGFAALLPLELSLTDFHQQERTADLPDRLSTDGSPRGATPRAGDIAYYAPWGTALVVDGGQTV
ncbi:cyclophilin-like fold protein [Streptomyces sp. NPDC058620]|uniref:cyclophilin-like fold protein n=1 Tax=Streptomyces sp. NPDC058620 TaxID=3346560 RepID=UPI003662751D